MSEVREQEERAVRYYERRLAEHGANARGVDWSSEESQMIRFRTLLQIVDLSLRGVTVLDYGCGYGALAEHALALPGVDAYVGYDASDAMISAAQEQIGGDPRCRLVGSSEPLGVADYGVASGVFNVRQDTDEETWWRYVCGLIDDLARHSRRGFAFNVLTSFSDEPLKRDHLFYAHPATVLDHCQTTYSRWASLLHDYGLYEFSVLVRCEEEGAWQS